MVVKKKLTAAHLTKGSEWVDSRYKYDINGREIEFNDGKGFWYKKDYDSLGNLIKITNSHGVWSTYTYDTFCNILTESDSFGYQSTSERNEFGHLMSFKNSRGRYIKYTRDKNGIEISKLVVSF